MDNTGVLTTTPQAHSSNRSGQLMCYLNRSIQFVIDTQRESEFPWRWDGSTVVWLYDFHEFGWHLGNAGLDNKNAIWHARSNAWFPLDSEIC